MKLLMVAVLLTMATGSFAQTKKGNLVLSGGTGLQFMSVNSKAIYDGKTTSENKGSSLSFTPSLAYFIVDNLAIGLAGKFTTTSSKNENAGNLYKNVSTSTMLLPTVLYYFPVEGKIKPLIQIGAGLDSYSYNSTYPGSIENKSSASGLALNFGGGIAYFMNENISLDLGLAYTSTKLTDGNDSKRKTKQGNFGANIGFSIYF